MLTSVERFEDEIYDNLAGRRFKEKYIYYFPLDYIYPVLKDSIEANWEHIKLASVYNSHMQEEYLSEFNIMNLIGFIEVNINHKLYKANIKVILFNDDKRITFMRDIITVLIGLSNKLKYLVEIRIINKNKPLIKMMNTAIDVLELPIQFVGLIPNTVLSRYGDAWSELIYIIDNNSKEYKKQLPAINKLWNKLMKVYNK